jgi:hypothetical protein
MTQHAELEVKLEQWERIIWDALYELKQAADRMTIEIRPLVPLPRPRQFEIAPGMFWPMIAENIRWTVIVNSSTKSYHHLPSSKRWATEKGAAEAVLKACRYRPRLILRSLRRIQAAAAWCEARYQGRLRMAEEILRSQRAAVEALEAEAAMAVLAQGLQ